MQSMRQARDIQHRSGKPVHEGSVHRSAERKWHPNKHGRRGKQEGQCVRRDAMEESEIQRR